MTPEQIRAEFALLRGKKGKKLTVRSIAHNIGCSDTAVHLVIDRKTVSKRVMTGIAEALDLPVEYVFPELLLKAS